MAKNIFFEFLAASCISSVLTNLIGVIFFQKCTYHGTLDFFTLIFLALGIYMARAVILRIWQATNGPEGFRSTMKIGSWIMPNPVLGKVIVDMPITHPTYVFVDLVNVICGILFYWIGSFATLSDICGWNYQYYFGRIFVVIAALFPIFRLVAWYVFKRQVPKQYCKGVYWPVVIFWIIAGAIIIPAFIVSYSK